MKTRKVFQSILIFCLILTLLLPSAKASAEGNPSIQASTVYDYVRTQGWPEGSVLNLTISGIGGYYTTNAVSEPISTSFDLQGRTVLPGDILTVTGGTTTKELQVSSMTVTAVDADVDAVWGTAEPGTQVNVWVCDETHCANRLPIANDSGNWIVNFLATEPYGNGFFDLVPGTSGGVNQFDNDGDWTEADWRVHPGPYFETSPDRDSVQVYDWFPIGVELTLTIGNETFTADVEVDPWDNSRTRTSFNLNGFDLKAGDNLEVTDVSTPSTVIAYTVGNIAMTGFDLAADTISGIGAPNEDVQVCFGVLNGCIWSSVTSTSNGTWTASFSGIGDLDTNSGGQLAQPSHLVNHTFVYWQIPSIDAYPTREWVRVVNWPVETDLTVTINDTYTFTNMWEGSNYPKDIYYMDLGGYDLKAGDLIKVTDNATPPNEITFTVGNVAQTGFDLAAGTISGIGTPGVEVFIIANTPENCPGQYVIPDSDGIFTVSFNDVCDGDLAPGGNGWLGQGTPGGWTSYEWIIPWIVANLTGNWVQLFNWPAGGSLTLSINDVNTFTNPVLFHSPGWDYAMFYLGGFDLKAGDNLKVTDNVTPPNGLIYTTTNLALTGFDLAADTISGIGTPGVDVGVCLGDLNSCMWSFVTPASDGTWTASFSGIGDEDLVIGSIGELSQTDQFGTTLFDWEISNTPPQITNMSVPNIPIPIGQSINATATFLDPDLNDTHTAAWDWGDGQTSPGIVDESNQTINGSHTYANAGVYTITLTLTDAAGETASAISEYVVIYDPSAGFVTGGGWIDSPVGAYTADPSLTGKATFGFNSKYQKGANIPTGNTEFQFKVGNLNFSSTAYDWLVIAGAKAQYKGVGTINGTGSYRFMLTAIDGQIDGGGGVDKFRIKIWDLFSDQVIYDNQLDAGDDAIPTTIIQGGSIVIHK